MMPKFTKTLYGDPITNALIAQVEGQKTHTRPFTWDTEDKKYTHITGGIILPTFDLPGYLITMGIVADDKNTFECLEEFESEDPYLLIKRAQDIQTEYGKCIDTWWGNPISLMPLVTETNIKGNPVYISSPVDSNQSDDFQIYVARIIVALSEEYQTMFIGECALFRNYLLSFKKDRTAKPENCPAIYITGALVHSLLIIRPWETAVERVSLKPTTFEETAAYEGKQAKKELYRYIYGVRK